MKAGERTDTVGFLGMAAAGWVLWGSAGKGRRRRGRRVYVAAAGKTDALHRSNSGAIGAAQRAQQDCAPPTRGRRLEVQCRAEGEIDRIEERESRGHSFDRGRSDIA